MSEHSDINYDENNNDNMPVVHNGEDQSFEFIDGEDLNGECFIAGEMGEVEVDDPSRRYVFRNNTPSANNQFEITAFSNQQAKQFLDDNFRYLKDNMGNQTFTDQQIARVCYIRLLAVRNGLVSRHFAIRNFHVRYSEIHMLNDNYVSIIRQDEVQNIINGLQVQVRNNLRASFTNMLGCVAYMFRVRGHHWVADMDEKYKDLWRKCLYTADTPGINWNMVAHQALHAVFPVIKDQYWFNMIQQNRIAGALVKRYDAAPAGCAGIKALEAGAVDISMSIPSFKERFPYLFEHLDDVKNQVRDNRWAGSINHNLYGAQRVNINETLFSGLAATIRSCLETFAPNSPLRRSMALQRIAGGAPITGAIMTRIIQTAATSEENARGLLVGNKQQG